MKKTVSLAVYCIFFLNVSCAFTYPAKDIDEIKSGKSFNRLGEFIISPGDTLNIITPGEQQMTGSFMVSPSGYLKLPLVGEVRATGISAADLGKKLTTRLKSYVKNPRVVVELQPRPIIVYFTGETGAKGPVTLNGKVNLLKALSQSGGLTEFASGRLILMRDVGPLTKERYEIYYDDIMEGRKNLDFFFLEDQDILHAE